jgi:septum formation protein
MLASASPARRRLLEQVGIPHRQLASGVDETAINCADSVQLVQLLARAKAEAVRQLLSSSAATEPQITAVLGCDSLLAFEGEVFGKPIDATEASSRLRRLRGAWGELHSGHCLLPTAAAPAAAVEQCCCVTTRVLFAELTDSEIEAYVSTGVPLQCAGGFDLEGVGGALVERIDGCYSNVIGLSLPLLRRWLANYQIDKFE